MHLWRGGSGIGGAKHLGSRWDTASLPLWFALENIQFEDLIEHVDDLSTMALAWIEVVWCYWRRLYSLKWDIRWTQVGYKMNPSEVSIQISDEVTYIRAEFVKPASAEFRRGFLHHDQEGKKHWSGVFFFLAGSWRRNSHSQWQVNEASSSIAPRASSTCYLLRPTPFLLPRCLLPGKLFLIPFCCTVRTPLMLNVHLHDAVSCIGEARDLRWWFGYRCRGHIQNPCMYMRPRLMIRAWKDVTTYTPV